MSETQEQQAPVWHAIVGDGYEPVQIGEIARPDDDVLVAGGWVRAYVDGGMVYCGDWKPRRRRKAKRFVVMIRDNDGRQTAVAFVQAGQCIEIGSRGELIPIEPIAEAEAER